MTNPSVWFAIVAALLFALGLATTFAKFTRRVPEADMGKKQNNLVAPNWNAIERYADLADMVQDWHFSSEDAFLAGPFQRYLELASDPRQPARASARIMEFCRGSLNDFAISNPEVINNSDAFEARARKMAAAWFAGTPHGDYMLEVLDGISNHNYRGASAD